MGISRICFTLEKKTTRWIWDQAAQLAEVVVAPGLGAGAQSAQLREGLGLGAQGVGAQGAGAQGAGGGVGAGA